MSQTLLNMGVRVTFYLLAAAGGLVGSTAQREHVLHLAVLRPEQLPERGGWCLCSLQHVHNRMRRLNTSARTFGQLQISS
jgi:hypothetical protein